MPSSDAERMMRSIFFEDWVVRIGGDRATNSASLGGGVLWKRANATIMRAAAEAAAMRKVRRCERLGRGVIL